MDRKGGTYFERGKGSWSSGGTITTRLRSTFVRFWEKVDDSDGPEGCWLWLAYTCPKGYGTFRGEDGNKVAARRWVYEKTFGPIPKGNVLERTCLSPTCVNPSHMRKVTPKQRIQCKVKRANTHCPAGHPYSGKNLRIGSQSKPSHSPHRLCKICARESQEEYKDREREEGGVKKGNSHWPIESFEPYVWMGPQRARATLRICEVCEKEFPTNTYQLEVRTGRGNGRYCSRACKDESQRRAPRKTHCIRGHEYTQENAIIIMRDGRPGRNCRECRRYHNRKYYKARKQADEQS